MLYEVITTGMGMRFEEYNSFLDRWFEVVASPMEGNRFIAVFSDITRHKQTEEDLLKSEKHYRLLHETMLVITSYSIHYTKLYEAKSLRVGR